MFDCKKEIPGGTVGGGGTRQIAFCGGGGMDIFWNYMYTFMK